MTRKVNSPGLHLVLAEVDRDGGVARNGLAKKSSVTAVIEAMLERFSAATPGSQLY